MTYKDLGNIIVRLFGIVMFMDALTEVTTVISHSLTTQVSFEARGLSESLHSAELFSMSVPVAVKLLLGLLVFWFSKPISNKAFFIPEANNRVDNSNFAFVIERISISVMGLYFLILGFIKVSGSLMLYIQARKAAPGNILEILHQPSIGFAQWIVAAIYFLIGSILFFRSEKIVAFRAKHSL